MNTPTPNPVFRAINKPLTVAGVERRVFGLVLIASSLVLTAFGMTGALLTFVVLFVVARWTTRRDPQFPRILVASRRFATLYDPEKRDWYPIK
jgi:type IV secretory pathway VirB3-like protein